ncbi:MAG: hypothetical protein KAJ01_06835, partial [Candidatus Hydrogenedentes bacterium]|nr:hypothetical protein [Candidatus Hydrogenedentota bacterium]
MDTSTEPVCADKETLRRILVGLRGRIGPQKFNAWFRHGTTVTLEDGHVKVAVANPFTANWIEQHYQTDLTEMVEEHTSGRLPVVVTIDPTLSAQCRKRDLDMQAEIVSRATQGRSRRRLPIKGPTLKHTLEDFVVGPSNRLAYT